MAGNMEKQTRALIWELVHDLLNLALLNGRGRWHAFPPWKKQTIRVRKSNPPTTRSVNRGLPKTYLMILKISLIILTVTLGIIGGIEIANAQENYTLTGSTFNAYAETDLDSVFLKLFNADSSLYDSGYSNNHEYTLSITTVGIDDLPNIPTEFNISAYPNPANPSMKVAFEIPKTGNYTIESFDLLGRQLAQVNKHFEPGSYEIPYGGAGTASGMQIIRVRGEGYNKTTKVTFLDGGIGSGFGNIEGGSNTSRFAKTLAKTAENLEFRLTAEKEGYEPYDTLLSIDA